jgi:phosphonate transport system substrate-binding protein
MSIAISRTLLALLALACALGSARAVCLGDPKAGVVHEVHVVPQLPPSVLMARWAPLLGQLGRQAGLCFELRIAPTIPDFETALLAGQPDFAFANPYHAVMARRAQGYLPLVVDNKEKLSGILVVRNDSPIRELKQLDGLAVAFPAPNAFAASLLMRARLAQQGTRIQPKYVKTHANVYRAVIMGDVAAGGGVNNTLERESPRLREQLRVLHQTPGYAPHPFVTHPRVAPQLREAVTQAFLRLGQDPQDSKLLDAIQIPNPVRADYARDFAPLESLHLDRFVLLNEKNRDQ